MTMKLIKASVGIAGVLALFACSNPSSSGPPNSGTGGGSAGSGGQGGGGQSGSGGTASGGTSGGTGGTGTDAAGTMDATGTGGTPMPADESVLEKGKRPSRDGNYIQPMMTKDA